MHIFHSLFLEMMYILLGCVISQMYYLIHETQNAEWYVVDGMKVISRRV